MLACGDPVLPIEIPGCDNDASANDVAVHDASSKADIGTDAACETSADASQDTNEAAVIYDAKSDDPNIWSADASSDVDIQQLFDPGTGISNTIFYYGGPILTGTPTVFFLWYGDWSNSTTPQILEDMITSFSGTPYSDILQGYYQVDPSDAGDDGGEAGADAAQVREYATGRIQFGGSYFVGYPFGSYLTLGADENVPADAIGKGTVPYDPNGLYFVLTSWDVGEDMGGPHSGFCYEYCGYHGNGHDNVDGGHPFHYAFVGDPTGTARCEKGCTMKEEYAQAGITHSPNNNLAADSMASVIIHELSETITDPYPFTNQAWIATRRGPEIGDICAWLFSPVYPTDGGSLANVHWGDRDYLIQQMLVNNGAGFNQPPLCAFHP